MGSASPAVRDEVADMVKLALIRESGLTLQAGQIAGDELLNGPVLRVASMGLLGMLIRLEDDLELTLPDDLFAGRTFRVVNDVVAVVFEAVQTQTGAA
jgi:acyl carrier protein